MSRRAPVLLSLAVCAFILLPPPAHGHAAAIPPGGTFRDDNGLALEGFIEAAAQAGLTGGCAPSLYCPDGIVDRQQAAAFVAAAFGVSGAPSPFVDTAGSYAADAIGGLAAAGLVQGCGAGAYCPARPVTRAEVAVLLAGAAALAPIPSPFLDTTGHFAAGAIGALAAAGLTSGCGEAMFCPDAALTRAEMAVYLVRATGREPAVFEMHPALTLAVPLQQGSTGQDVGILETLLADLAYDPGSVDWVFDDRTYFAVLAFQKVEGLARTGVADAATASALARASTPGPRHAPGVPDWIEVDKARQIMLVIEDYEVLRVIAVSTGKASTPTPSGAYAVYKKVEGFRVSGLGVLYRPLYVVRGIAIHGYPSVPEFPASHGCIRVPNWEADWLFERTPVGVPVFLD